ncbi:MAG: hypothetical protein HEEMFOPI_01047 [Holosporales bacterium]
MNTDNNIDLPNWFELIQSEREYYVNAYQRQQKRRLKWSFNWSAVLFGPAWFAYRKMYRESIILSLLHILIFSIEYLLQFSCLVYIEMLFFAFFSNCFYAWSLKKKYANGIRLEDYIDVNKQCFIIFCISGVCITMMELVYFRDDIIKMIIELKDLFTIQDLNDLDKIEQHENISQSFSIDEYTIYLLDSLLDIFIGLYFYLKEKKNI